jgi:hypothetical protein
MRKLLTAAILAAITITTILAGFTVAAVLTHPAITACPQLNDVQIQEARTQGAITADLIHNLLRADGSVPHDREYIKRTMYRSAQAELGPDNVNLEQFLNVAADAAEERLKELGIE